MCSMEVGVEQGLSKHNFSAFGIISIHDAYSIVLVAAECAIGTCYPGDLYLLAKILFLQMLLSNSTDKHPTCIINVLRCT